jgi:signal transduction histidine kinase/ActR/RegA family two-component response regulator
MPGDGKILDDKSESTGGVGRVGLLRDDGTETIDLSNLFSRDLTTSGSYDVRGVGASSFGKLLQAVPIPALLLDRSAKIIFVNESFRRLAGDNTKTIGESFSSLFPRTRDAGLAREAVEEVIATRKRQVFEALLTIGASSIWGRSHLRSLRLGGVRSLLLLIEDLTNEKKRLLLIKKHREELERRVEERTEELVRINRQLENEIAQRKRAEEELRKSERAAAVAEIAGGVAHNFNNLLQIVLHSAQMALTYLDAGKLDQLRSKIEQVMESSVLGSETVRRLQDFTSSNPAEWRGKTEVVDLSAAARRAIEMSQAWWQANLEQDGKRICFVEDLQPDCLVDGNESELLEVVLNLIKNSVEAISGEGRIEVRTLAASGQAFLVIKDNGAGISAENLSKVFEPFWTTKGYHGTGMGLSCSLGIVKRHAGDLVLESCEGKGVSVTVKFPRSTRITVERKKTARPVTVVPLRLLVVDDEKDTLSLLEEGLAAHGHEVLAALSGAQAVDIFRNNHIDCVISDLAMPAMNGWELGEAIKYRCAQTKQAKPPFLLLTGWGRLLRDEVKREQSGVDRVLEKPLSLPDLLSVIAEVVQPGSPNGPSE